MQISKLKNKFKNEYVFAVLLKGLIIIIGLLRTVFWARYLGAGLKGEVEYIRNIASIGLVVCAFGIYEAYPYYRKKYGKDKVLRPFLSITFLQFIIYIIISVSLYFLLINTEKDYAFAAIIIPILSFSRIVQYIYLIENPNRANIKNLLVNIVDLVYSIILFKFANRDFLLGITGIFSIQLLQAISSIRYLIGEIKNENIESYGEKIITIKELVKFGFFPMLAALLTTLNYRIDVIMLKSFKNITPEQIGVYSLGITLVEKIILIPDTLKAVLASRLTKGKGPEEVAKLTRICLLISVCITAITLLIGQKAIDLFYGIEYSGAFGIVLISAAGVLFIMFFKLIAQYNIVNKRQVRNFLMLVISIIINITLNYFLIPIWGISGAAVATCAGHAVCGAVFIIDFHKQTGVPYRKIIIIQKEDINKIRNGI